MNSLIAYLVKTGIPEQAIFLLLAFPILATIISFMRHVVGIRTLGLYITILLTYAMYLLSISDGSTPDSASSILISLPIVIGIISLARWLRIGSKKIRMHYMPRMSLILSIIIIVASVPLFSIALIFDTQISLSHVASVIITTSISERYISLLIAKNEQRVRRQMLESIIIATLLFLFLTWSFAREFLLSYPYLSLLPIVLDVILGVATSIRLTEIARFSSIFKQETKDETN